MFKLAQKMEYRQKKIIYDRRSKNGYDLCKKISHKGFLFRSGNLLNFVKKSIKLTNIN